MSRSLPAAAKEPSGAISIWRRSGATQAWKCHRRKGDPEAKGVKLVVVFEVFLVKSLVLLVLIFNDACGRAIVGGSFTLAAFRDGDEIFGDRVFPAVWRVNVNVPMTTRFISARIDFPTLSRNSGRGLP